MRSIFDMPIAGPLLRLLFSERGQVALTYVFMLGAACWLSGYLLEIAALVLTGKYMMWTSLVLIGSWILIVMFLIGLDRLLGRDQRAGFANPSQKEILKRLELALERGEVELSLQFNAEEVRFVSVHGQDDFFTLAVTGGQTDPVDAEIGDYLRTLLEHRLMIEKGKNLWRRRVVLEDRMKLQGSTDSE